MGAYCRLANLAQFCTLPAAGNTGNRHRSGWLPPRKEKGLRRGRSDCTSHQPENARRRGDKHHQRIVLETDKVVNAAGPMAKKVASMVNIDLPIQNYFQQKFAFVDRRGEVPRTVPFCIDLDTQYLNWSEEERLDLADDDEQTSNHSLLRQFPGAVHCRPDGQGQWVRLGWAYNNVESRPTWEYEQHLDELFPEIVLRGASRLHPGLIKYVLHDFPRKQDRHHYGGWYTMTEENWPLIGPMGPEGAFMNCAHLWR